MQESLGGNPGSASVTGTHLTSRDSVSSVSVGSDHTHLPEPCTLSGKPLVQCLVRERICPVTDGCSIIVSALGTQGGIKLG